MDRNGCAELSALEEFCAWHGSDFARGPSYLEGLGDAEIAELRAALPGLKARCAELTQLRRAEVPFKSLTGRLADWRDQIVYGRGFVVLRRLPIERMGEEEIGLALAALSAHLGRTPPRPDRLSGTECERPLATGEGGLTALLCLREPKHGFTVQLASAVALHNELLAHEPKILAALYEPDQATGAPAAFARLGTRLAACLGQDAGGARRAKAQGAALARAEADALRIDFEPGDVLFVNNRHALYGVARHGAGGSLLHLALESGLVAAQPVAERAQASRPDWQARRVESEAA